MIASPFDERFRQLMNNKLEEIAGTIRTQFTKDSANAAQRGGGSPSTLYHVRQKERLMWVEQRASAVFEIHRRLLSNLNVAYTDTLATDLKKYLHEWVSPQWCEKLMEGNPPPEEFLRKRYSQEIMAARDKVVSALCAEIDLAVDAIRSKASTVPSQDNRQRDQKFGVLWSPTEASKDFERWNSDLGTEGGSIAVIYCDLDLFKAINTKYTEPIVDEQFIPAALNIIDRYVRLRGYGYQEGGDEYVVILPNYEADEAVAFAEKIRTAFEHYVFIINQDRVPVTLSAGVALWPVHGSTFREVLAKAAEAKRAAKHQRNCVRLARIESSNDQPLPASGLSQTAQRVAVLASNESVNGLVRDPILNAVSLCTTLSISEEDLAVAADELQERGWTEDRPTMQLSKAGFSSLWPTEKFFIETDGQLKGWNPKSDAKKVAQELLKASQQTTRLSRIDETLKWGPRRLNPAVYFLVSRDIIKFSKTMDAFPYCYGQIWGTPRTARFVCGE